ncbi:hypothetical protein ACJIZ3_019434 [Penstemon smallii]|uniref:Major facilitator superfamily (MFS) profile domain-containing protein n=1 Tax=Penstemon smallii TaxID=265156 RepID=A0ABD3T2P6_9LAMI
MTIGGINTKVKGNYEGRVTPFVVISCVVAATGGLIFGYDIGISGGVTSMDEFLMKFFPAVYRRQMDTSGNESQYCKFENHLLTLFTSSLYLAALISSFFASATTRRFGRKISMTVGGSVFLIGAILNGAAMNVEMLIIGRLLLGVGIGYGNQSVPVYLSEMAPPKLRGALNIGFQMMTTIGILAASLVNYGTAQMKANGWRVSLVLAGVPAVIMTVGAIMLPDTPNSMIERGQKEEARAMLQKIRGTTEVDEEFNDLIEASEASQKVPNPWKTIFEHKYRPQLVITCLIPFFQQVTGINVIMFYAPVLFRTLGFANDASLMSAVVTGLVNVFATVVSILAVDKFGRRVLFLEGGIQMIICQIGVGASIASVFGVSGQGTFNKAFGNVALSFICIYVAAFAWSWGPLGWLVPSEIHPMETRSAGQSINVSINMFFTFIIGQLFLSMLCHMKFGLFFFFAGWVFIMTVFVYMFVPETKNMPIEEMNKVWKAHWFWGKYIPEDAVGLGNHKQDVEKEFKRKLVTMAIGGINTKVKGNYEGRVTPFVVISCVVAATGGLIFGYDIGISGGVTSMDEFLMKFFPSVYRRQMDTSGNESQYCKFENHLLTLFTSSLYLAALISSFFASATTRKFGRKISMTVGGSVFLIGAILNGAAMNVEMLIIGRLLLGVGIGYGNQSVPVYLSEMAPPKLRGALNIGFQMMTTIGILAASLVNYGTAQMKANGWRVSLVLAGVPALIMTVGAIMLPDTPNSMIERGQKEEARAMLQKIRGTTEVDEEFNDLIEASEASLKVPNPWKTIFEHKYRPQLVITCLIPFFQQVTGINVIMFYAPVLFRTLGFANDASLMSAVVTGLVNVFATVVSILAVDKFGRRVLFLEGGIQMIICQIGVGASIASVFGVSGQGTFNKAFGNVALSFICIYVAAFAWSWGPLGWLVPSEIHPMETRSAGQSINVSINMFFTFIIGQLFLSMLCHMKFGLFFFFAGWVFIMTVFVYMFVPETKNMPIEEMNKVWKAHWFWGKYIPEDAVGLGNHKHDV